MVSIWELAPRQRRTSKVSRFASQHRFVRSVRNDLAFWGLEVVALMCKRLEEVVLAGSLHRGFLLPSVSGATVWVEFCCSGHSNPESLPASAEESRFGFVEGAFRISGSRIWADFRTKRCSQDSGKSCTCDAQFWGARQGHETGRVRCTRPRPSRSR